MTQLPKVVQRSISKHNRLIRRAMASVHSNRCSGDNKAGAGHAIAQAIADAGINVGFLMAQVIGRRYSAVIGFDTDADAKKAAPLIKKATPKKP